MKNPLRNLVLAAAFAASALAGCGNDDNDVIASPPRKEAPQAITYSLGVFGYPYDHVLPLTLQQQYAKELADSGFGAVIHGFFHIYPDASIVLNSHPYPVVYADGTVNVDMLPLRDIYRQLKAGGKLRYVLITIGGGDCRTCPHSQTDYNFSRIMYYDKLYPDPATNPVFKNLLALKKAFEFDGIDLDYEPVTEWMSAYNDEFGDLLVKMTKWAKSNGMMVTAAPYRTDQTAFWRRYLEKTVGADGNQLVDWLNIQLYSSNYDAWMTAFADAKIGVTDKARFMAAGYACGDPDSSPDPASVQTKIGNLKKRYPGLTSGFMWQYGDMVPVPAPEPPPNGHPKCQGTAAQFAQAIVDGVTKPQ